MDTAVVEKPQTMREFCDEVDANFPETIELPKPSEDLQRRTNATHQLHDAYHTSLLSFRTRCWQAEQLGLQRKNLLEIAQMLTGKNYSKVKTWYGWDSRPAPWSHRDPAEHKFEWFHTTGTKARSASFGQEPIFIKRFLGPTLALSRMANLQEEIPYGALLKAEQLKEAKLFNCFSVIGPKKAFRSLAKPQPEPIDPVLVGCIYNLQRDKLSSLDDPNYVAYYPLAMW